MTHKKQKWSVCVCARICMQPVHYVQIGRVRGEMVLSVTCCSTSGLVRLRVSVQLPPSSDPLSSSFVDRQDIF